MKQPGERAAGPSRSLSGDRERARSRDTTTSVTVAESATTSVDVHAGAPTDGVFGGELKTSSSTRTAGWVMGGIGVAGLAVGSVAAFLRWDTRAPSTTTATRTRNNATRAGYDAAQSGKTLGLVTTTGLVVGAVGVGIGAYLLLSNGNGRVTHRRHRRVDGQRDRRFSGATLVASDGEHPKGWTFVVHRRT